MIALITAIAVVCICMFFQDVLGSGLTISQSRGLAFFPGFFDGLGDFATRYRGAAIAVTTVRFGLGSWQTFVVISACALTSFFTSNAATGKESLILPKDNLDHVTLHEMWSRLTTKTPHVEAHKENR